VTFRQRVRTVEFAVLLVPVCVVVYHLTTVAVGALAEPIVAPTPPFVVIDHFHVELYLEALFLAAALVVPIPRAAVWGIGVFVIPTLPVWLAIWGRGAPGASVGRSLLQDATLWSLEGVAGGIVACATWELARRAARRPAVRTQKLAGSGDVAWSEPPNEGMDQTKR